MREVDTGMFSFRQLRRVLVGKRIRVRYQDLRLSKRGVVKDVSDEGIVLDSGLARITPDISVSVI
jgi:hypothetical protein